MCHPKRISPECPTPTSLKQGMIRVLLQNPGWLGFCQLAAPTLTMVGPRHWCRPDLQVRSSRGSGRPQSPRPVLQTVRPFSSGLSRLPPSPPTPRDALILLPPKGTLRPAPLCAPPPGLKHHRRPSKSSGRVRGSGSGSPSGSAPNLPLSDLTPRPLLLEDRSLTPPG